MFGDITDKQKRYTLVLRCIYFLVDTLMPFNTFISTNFLSKLLWNPFLTGELYLMRWMFQEFCSLVPRKCWKLVETLEHKLKSFLFLFFIFGNCCNCHKFVFFYEPLKMLISLLWVGKRLSFFLKKNNIASFLFAVIFLVSRMWNVVRKVFYFEQRIKPLWGYILLSLVCSRS